MSRAQCIGLIAAGKITDSPLVRIWISRERLGPVKAPSVRVASRFANALRAGHPVIDYQEFEDCGLVLISVPDSMVPDIVAELLSQPFTWANKAVVLCSALLGARNLEGLAARGASVGSLCPIPGFEDRWFVLEGDKHVEARVNRIIDASHTRFTLIRPSCKPSFVAALASTGPMLIPLLIKASDSLRKAGVPVTESEAILAKQVERSMRLYFRAGRKVHPARRPSVHSQERIQDTDVNVSAQVRSQHS